MILTGPNRKFLEKDKVRRRKAARELLIGEWIASVEDFFERRRNGTLLNDDEKARAEIHGVEAVIRQKALVELPCTVLVVNLQFDGLMEAKERRSLARQIALISSILRDTDARIMLWLARFKPTNLPDDLDAVARNVTRWRKRGEYFARLRRNRDVFIEQRLQNMLGQHQLENTSDVSTLEEHLKEEIEKEFPPLPPLPDVSSLPRASLTDGDESSSDILRRFGAGFR